MTQGQKEAILKQIKIVEDNVSRLRVLVEADLAEKPNTEVARYCCIKASIQVLNIQEDLLKLERKNLTVKNEG